MSEGEAIEESDEPVTADRIEAGLRALGLAAGDAVLVHSSLSSLGWVCGGAPAVVDALLNVVTDDGTVVMPTHTGYSDPADWENPPVPDDWLDEIRATMPPYRPEVTPTRGMGAIPECFRSYPGVARSRHPHYSFAARGADAERIVADHEYDFGLGESSPLARLYDLGGSVLLLGAGHDSNTSLHLAEHRGRYETEVVTGGAPVLVDGAREWVTLEAIDYDDSDFGAAGEAFERERPEAVARGRVGRADSAVVNQRELVDFAGEWFGRTR
ncbi:aminoglycoside N(3)-acetyltransferase [Haladaptatus salinisoli]|uniref:aminoglycoside N(3)-acetyltransferase n=1 Tax=Haladaptatus salinisoli TaxID=2884876 RepID=UPI001D0B7280|nr:AAC(3) family N-acetyltransferase [Haladaptatus salinisoli]